VASEFPQGNRRRPINWRDDTNTDKYYAATEVSAIAGSRNAADSPLKPGEEPQAIPTPTYRLDETNTDKYYRDGGVRNRAGDRRRLAAAGDGDVGDKADKRKAQVDKQIKSQRLSVARDLIVLTADDVRDVVDRAAQKVAAGPVVVHVRAGDRNLLNRTRAAVEMLVTRETISEDQGRDIRLAYLPDPKTGLTAPSPEVTRQVPKDNVDVPHDLDVAGAVFGNAALPGDDQMDVSPVAPTVVEDDFYDPTVCMAPEDAPSLADEPAAYTVPGVEKVPDHHIGTDQPAMTAPQADPEKAAEAAAEVLGRDAAVTPCETSAVIDQDTGEPVSGEPNLAGDTFDATPPTPAQGTTGRRRNRGNRNQGNQGS
jgi:hypothetical protein